MTPMTPMAPETLAIAPIGWARTDRNEIRFDDWGGVLSEIHLDSAQFGPEALMGLETFSHLEVVFLFDRIPLEQIVSGSLHPRGRRDLPQVGIFATRQKERKNRLGVSRCRLIGVEGLILRVQDLDVLDGTPVLDVKPYVREFGPRGEVEQPAWMTELMASYYG